MGGLREGVGSGPRPRSPLEVWAGGLEEVFSPANECVALEAAAERGRGVQGEPFVFVPQQLRGTAAGQFQSV